MIDRFAQLAQAAPRATLAVPFFLIEFARALAVLSLLAPVIFVRRREPFERLAVTLELVLGRTAGRAGHLPGGWGGGERQRSLETETRQDRWR